MVKKKFKYIASVFLMIVIAFTFIFSALLRVINRDTSKAAATVQVSSVEELKNAINGTDEEIEIMGNIDIPCEILTLSSTPGNTKTAEIVINRSVTIKSGGDSSTKTLKRTSSIDGEDSGLVSMFEIIGDGITVNFENIILDGGATLPDSVSDRIDFSGSGSICGRALIDVLKNSTLNIGNNCTIQNSFNNSNISAHGYNRNLTPCGGAIRTDCYKDDSVDLRGGTINLLSGSEIKNCSTKAKNGSGSYAATLASYGGAVAAYEEGAINMYEGAAIQDCTSSNGGAIGLCHGSSTPCITGTLNLSGGTINNCYAIKGGAINVGENSDETPRLNLTGTGTTTFSNCQSREGGAVIYIDTGNKIQLAENQDNTGNVQIGTNCTGGSAKGSDGENIPTNYVGYKNQIEFEAATANSSYFENCCVTNNAENAENNNSNSESNITPRIEGGVAYYEVSTSAQLNQAFEDSTNSKINIKLTENNILQQDIYNIGKSGISQFIVLDLNGKTLRGHLSSGEAWKIQDDSTLVIKNGAATRVDLATNSRGCLVLSNVNTQDGRTYNDDRSESQGNGVYIGTANCWVLNNSTIANFKAELGTVNGGNSNTLSYLTSFENTEEKKAQLRANGVSGDSSISSYQTGGNLATVLVGKGDTARCFATLQEAFNFVANNSINYNKITLLSDYEMPTEEILSTLGVTLDLWGNTITQTDANKLRISHKEGSITICNGEITGGSFDMVNGSTNNGAYTKGEYAGGNVNLENLTVPSGITTDSHSFTITSGNYSNVFIAQNGGTINISGGTFTGDITSSNGADINISGGYFSGNINKGTDSGAINITGGKFVNAVGPLLASPYAQKSISEEYGGRTYSYEVINHPSHGNWTYSTENSNTLKAHCGTCDFSVSLQLNAPTSKNYDGNAIAAASFDGTGSANWTSAGLTLPEITYEGTGTTSYSSSTTPPTDAGSYVAKISATGTDNATKTVEVSFNINKATPTLDLFEISGLEHTYDGTGKSVTVSEKDGKTEFTGKVTVEYKYTKDGTEDWYVWAPMYAWEYNVRVNIPETTNYNGANLELGNNKKLKINKAAPTKNMFTFNDSNTVYDGQVKEAQIEFNKNYDDNIEHGGMGEVTVHYYSDASRTNDKEINASDIKNAGTYYVGITVAEGDNYTAQSATIYDDSWNFEISKKAPAANDFTFTSPTGLVYSGSAQTDLGTFATSANGMGQYSIHYYSDSARTQGISASDIKNAGTYYVGITVAEGDNYLATGENVLLASENWKFTINKATPTLDLFEISGLEHTYDGIGKSVIVNEKGGKTEFTNKVTTEYFYTKDGTEGWHTEPPINAGEYPVRLVITGADNYSDANIELGASNKLKINKAIGQLPNVDAISATYGQTLNELNLPTPDSGTFAWVDENTKLTTVSSGQTFGSTFTPNDTDNYDWSEAGIDANGNIAVSLAVNVGKANLTKEMFNLNSSEGIFDGNEKTLNLSIPEGLSSYSLEYSSDDGTTWTTNLPKKAGAYKIKVKSENDTNYNDAEIVLDSNFKVNKAIGQLPNVDAISATYGQTLNELNLPTPDSGTFAWVDENTKLTTVSSGQAFGATFTPNDTDNYDWTEAGIGADGNIAVSLTVNVGKANLTKEMFTLNSTEGIYDGNGKTLNLSVPEGLSSYSLEYSSDNGTTWTTNLPKNAGNYKIKVKSENDTNYNDAEIVLDSNFKVNKATGQLPNVDAISATYGQTLNELTLPTSNSGTFAWVDENTKLTTVSSGQTFGTTFTPNDTDNYDWTETGIDANGKIAVSLAVNVGKANLTKEMFTLNSAEGIFDGNEKTLNLSIPEGLSSYSLEYSSDDGTTWTTNLPKNAGNYKIKVKSENDANYNNAEIVLDTTYTITTRVDDGYITDEHGLLKYKNLGNNTYDIKGFVNGEWRQVTYGNKGFKAKTWPQSTLEGIKITTEPRFVADGKGILLQYNLENTTGEPINNFRFFVAGDTAVNGNDKNENTVDEEGTAILHSGDVSFFAFSPSQGGTAVPAYYGSGGTVSYCSVLDGADPSTTTFCKENNVDSAIVSYYPLVSLASGQSLNYNICFGENESNTVKEVIQEIKDDLGIVNVNMKNSKGDTIGYTNVQKGTKVEELIEPSVPSPGMSFDGWYDDINLTTQKDNSFEINENTTIYVKWRKGDPIADYFNFNPPNNQEYDGNKKTASVSVNSGVNGMGEVTVHYFKNAERTEEISPDEVKDAGTYYVGITVSEGENYFATKENVLLSSQNWNFTIDKVAPKASDFTFTSPENLVYDGRVKTATVTPASGVVGMGNVTVRYYSDEARTKEISANDIKNAGTYYVGITVTEGDNYLATEENVLLASENWNFTIDKNIPDPVDFAFTPPENLVYDGSVKTATVAPASGVVGMGDITVRYYSDEARTKEINTNEVKNAGTYYVGVVTLEGDNYLAPSEVLTDKNWKFTIEKETPTLDLFEISGLEHTYDGTGKSVTVTEKDNKTEFKDKVTVEYKYTIDGREGWYVWAPTYAWEYNVRINISGAKNYKDAILELGDNKKLKINKAKPTLNDFIFTAPNDLVYDGNIKEASIEAKDGIEGMGDVFLKYNYISDDGVWHRDVEQDNVKNAGKYVVQIWVNEGANYTNEYITNDDVWKFEISKATPKASDFTFTPPENLVYDGNVKTATIAPASGVVGMGNITVRYYSDEARTKEISANDIKNVGTYYVGITIAEGPNYLATEKNILLISENWKFTIDKAEPILDFNIISGGPTGQDSQLQTENIPEFYYGKTLEDYKDSLPKSESGTWNFKDTTKELKPAGTQYIELVFTPSDTDNFDWTKVPGYDPKTKTVTVKLLVDVVVEKETWGVPINNNGVVNYESSDGSTSAEITGNDVYWVKETSYDSDLGRNTSSWYGVDNSKGVFEKGSRLLIRWINKEENPEEWNEYLPMIDSQEAQNIPDRKRWIFIAEVIHPDGVTRYEKLDQSVPLYIQKGEDWDTEEGVEAYFISQGADERLNKEYIDNMAYPGGNGGFFKLDLLHFSPYTIYDADPVSSSQNNNGSEKDGNQNKDGEDSQNKSNQENTKNGVNPWYMVAGVGLLGMSLLIGFLIYKKRKKEKDAVMYSILAQIGRSSTSN